MTTEFVVEFGEGGAGIDAVHALLHRLWEGWPGALGPPPDAIWRSAFATAVGEIAANILRHACPPVGAACAPQLAIRATPAGFEAVFTDRGIAFPGPLPAAPPHLADTPPWDLPEGGLGLRLAHAAVDDLRYDRTGEGENCWRLWKALSGGDGRA